MSTCARHDNVRESADGDDDYEQDDVDDNS